MELVGSQGRDVVGCDVGRVDEDADHWSMQFASTCIPRMILCGNPVAFCCCVSAIDIGTLVNKKIVLLLVIDNSR